MRRANLIGNRLGDFSTFFPSLDDCDPDLVRAPVELHLPPILARVLLPNVGVQHLAASQVNAPMHDTRRVWPHLRRVPVLIVYNFDFQI